MNQKQKTALANIALVLFALLAVNQLKTSWTQEVHPNLNLTTVQKPYRLQSGKSVVLSRDELQALSLIFKDTDQTEVLSVALSFRGGAPAVYAIPPLSMVSGEYTVEAIGTFKWQQLPAFDVTLNGAFTVDSKPHVSIALE